MPYAFRVRIPHAPGEKSETVLLHRRHGRQGNPQHDERHEQDREGRENQAQVQEDAVSQHLAAARRLRRCRPFVKRTPPLARR